MKNNRIHNFLLAAFIQPFFCAGMIEIPPQKPRFEKGDMCRFTKQDLPDIFQAACEERLSIEILDDCQGRFKIPSFELAVMEKCFWIDTSIVRDFFYQCFSLDVANCFATYHRYPETAFFSMDELKDFIPDCYKGFFYVVRIVDQEYCAAECWLEKIEEKSDSENTGSEDADFVKIDQPSDEDEFIEV